jgi:hypothetical protein
MTRADEIFILFGFAVRIFARLSAIRAPAAAG